MYIYKSYYSREDRIMWSAGVLLPHAPILVPEIAYRSGVSPGKTLEAVNYLKFTLKGFVPEYILLLDPHAQTGPGPCVINSERFYGSLVGFGAGDIRIEAAGAGEEGSSLVGHINRIFPINENKPGSFSMDYASIVPLLFIKRIFGKIPPLLILNPVILDYSGAYDFGVHLRKFRSTRDWLLLASGDLSHRLTQDSPAGFHPDGEVVDRKIRNSMETSSPEPILSLSKRSIQNAGECGLRSVLALIGISLGEKIDLLSYESPFGVGYATALWQREIFRVGKKEHPLILARRSIEKTSMGNKPDDYLEEMPFMANKEIEGKRACFVSIKTMDGDLRGCIGTVFPARSTLWEEIIFNAHAAACQDPRFKPVGREELARCRISVDVLEEPERIADLSLLEPKIYGVIVEKDSRRGVLLPDLEGVENTERQVDIALAKAGIVSKERVSISRFRVSRFSE
ncbi:MAG TPA: AmmeMemoRadiSam system protein A [Synergistetes bacterium]|nr:AmmeMemoRadiSam system protein A [Synergistota bacterium]